MIFRLVLAFVCAVLAACAHIVVPPVPLVSSDNNLPVLPLLSPASARSDFSASQILVVTRDGQTTELDSVLEWDKTRVSLALLKFGHRVLSVAYDGEHLDVQKDSRVPDALAAEQVLRDIQLVYWPLDALRAHLPEGYVLDEAAGVRDLSYRGEKIYHIEYSPVGSRRIRLVHSRYGYDITIVSH